MTLNRNVRVVMKEGNQEGKFDIYLDVYGQEKYLMSHRYDGRLCAILKKRPAVMDLRDIMDRQVSHDLKKKIKYLITVVNDYLKYELDFQ